MSLLAAIPLLGKVIDKAFPDAEQRQQANQAVTELLLNGELQTLAQQAGVIQAEAKGDSFLQRSWRPIVMLVFTTLVVCRWMGWSAPNLDAEVELKLLSIIQLGIGGYIASRGFEKVARTFGKNAV